MSKLHNHFNIINTAVKIVVIEDEEILLNNICQYLKICGYTTVCFSDPLKALEYLANYKVDVIISDIKMPNIEGTELIKKIRTNKLNKKAIFIFLSAKAEKEDVRLGMNLLADDYITKPFAMKDLLNSIDNKLILLRERFNEGRVIDKKLFKMLSCLTKSELRVIYLISTGEANIQIAAKLSISYKTADNHRTNISNKLGINGRNSLIKFSIKNRLIIEDYILSKMRGVPYLF